VLSPQIRYEGMNGPSSALWYNGQNGGILWSIIMDENPSEKEAGHYSEGEARAQRAVPIRERRDLQAAE
jgi:hypothetical protein